MEIKKGYKQTEVGVIPSDWLVKELGKYVVITSGESPSKFRFNDDGIPYFKVDQLNNSDKYIKETPYHIESKICVPKGSIIFPKRGASILLNKVRILAEDSFMDTNLMSLTISNELDNEYLYYSLVHTELWRIADTTSIPQINNKHIIPLRIPLPPTKAEQTAIATALSDADALIESLEKLITKKRNIKQGAMQQLLTGKKRLPGFNGKWEVMKFTDVCWFQEGPGVRNTQFTCSGVKLLNGTNIFKGKLLLENTDRFISESEAFGPYSHFLADEGDIVIACSGITIDRFDEKISFVKKEHLPLCMNTSTMRFKPDEELLNPRYLYYYLMSRTFKNQIGTQATGSAQLNFGPSHVKKAEIILPKPEEQTAIAKVLSDMDAEIEVLEQKLAKYRMIKQGMMQELLTGKTRLI